MRLNVKETGADAIFLNRWKSSFRLVPLPPIKYFWWKQNKNAGEMLHYMYILIFLLRFFRNWREAGFSKALVTFSLGLKSKATALWVRFLS